MKKIFYLIMLVVLGVSAYYGYTIFTQKSQPAVVDKNKITVSMKIDIDASSEFVAYDVANGETALDLLQQTQIVETQGQGINAYVYGINNVSVNRKLNQYWSFLVNGQPATVGAGSYHLKNGDRIEWKIQNY